MGSRAEKMRIRRTRDKEERQQERKKENGKKEENRREVKFHGQKILLIVSLTLRTGL